MQVRRISPHEVELRAGDEPVCDFCSSTPVTYSFDAVPHRMDESAEPEHWSADAWAACEECARLVDEGRREELAVRSVDMLLRRSPQMRVVPRRELLREITQVHARFWLAKRGSSRPE